MNHKGSQRLSQAVEQYLLQRIEQGYPDTHIDTQQKILRDFRLFVERQPKEWDEIFTLEILKGFMRQGNGNERQRAVRGLANFLYREKQITQPIPRKSRPRLPELFEDYLHYCTTTRYDTDKTVQHIRRVLEAFDHYLTHHNLNLSAITIEEKVKSAVDLRSNILPCSLKNIAAKSISWIFSEEPKLSSQARLRLNAEARQVKLRFPHIIYGLPTFIM